jgi:DNA-binding PadR family transcriptional regulator
MRRARPESRPAGQPLTPVEFHILLSLADHERHGYAILQDVSERTGEQLRTGTLYTVIKRMLDGGWLLEADAPRGESDERRRFYGLTATGREALKAEAVRLQNLVSLAQEKRVLGRGRRLAPERGR